MDDAFYTDLKLRLTGSGRHCELTGTGLQTLLVRPRRRLVEFFAGCEG